MKRKFLKIIFLLSVCSSYAQSGTSSPYSTKGYGETSFRGNHEYRAMGGVTVESDSIHLNLQNLIGTGTRA